MKKILLIDGHPDETRLTSALMSAYRSGAEEAGYHVSQIVIRELAFEPNLQFGYKQRLELEPDLLAAIDAIKPPITWSNARLVGWLRQLKGFIDRTFLPSIMFDYNEAKLGGMGWDGYLEGKTARIIATMDTPKVLYRLLYSAPSVNQLKKTTLEFCGVKPVKANAFAPFQLDAREVGPLRIKTHKGCVRDERSNVPQVLLGFKSR